MSKYDKITFAPPTRAETGDGLGRKMRDSCRACANSKVKCRREKPTCSRCAKRKVPCEYLPTKRGGRKSLRPRSPSSPTPLAEAMMTRRPIPLVGGRPRHRRRGL
ncbi:hypothetical protein PG997_001931 [Apiospora hydei]|uniref:Zn(2)-C6 fungal-type domain-containing protein n=1 Tax=Apiospora hydei TaxID=1337664 RepID=A0ABR1X7Y5_9PEZI